MFERRERRRYVNKVLAFAADLEIGDHVEHFHGAEKASIAGGRAYSGQRKQRTSKFQWRIELTLNPSRLHPLRHIFNASAGPSSSLFVPGSSPETTFSNWARGPDIRQAFWRPEGAK